MPISPNKTSNLTDSPNTSKHLAFYIILGASIAAPAEAAPPPRLVRDINPGKSNSTPTQLTSMGGIVYFSADDGMNGKELWKSDGTSNGTVRLTSLAGSGYGPLDLMATANTLYFSADDGAHGREPWKSDGSPAGTVMLKDIAAGNDTSSPISFTQAGNIVYFRAWDLKDRVWKTDGTAQGTVIAKYPMYGYDYFGAINFTAVGSMMFYSATEPHTGYELRRADDSSQYVREIWGGSQGSNPRNLIAMGSMLYFEADDPAFGDAGGPWLWKSDGTSDGTVKIKKVRQSETKPVVVGSTLYFDGTDSSSGTALWKSDGTTAGTLFVKNVTPRNLTAVGNTLFFMANDGAHGNELWKSDGTDAGTVMVKDIRPGSLASSPSNLTAMGSMLYFTANNGSNGVELWRSDGTEAGTILVADITGGPSSSSPQQLCAVGNCLYFSAATAAAGRELYVYDPTLPDPPALTALSAHTIRATSTTLSGSVNPNGGASSAWIEYGTTSAYGNMLPITLSPADGSSDQSFHIVLNGLTPSTSYQYRIVASNAGGTSTSANGSFTTTSHSDISVGASTLAFGQCAVGKFAELSLSISNTSSSGVLEFSSAAVHGSQANQFSIVSAVPATLSPGASIQCTVRYTPSSVGVKSATLTFLTNDPDEGSLSIPLSGTAISAFADWANTHNVTGGETGNDDGDNLTNLQEYAFGTQPLSPSTTPANENGGVVLSPGTPSVKVVTNETGTHYHALFSRRIDRAASGLVYMPLFSNDLATWFNESTTPQVLASDSEVEIVSLPFPAALPDGKTARFFRLSVRLP